MLSELSVMWQPCICISLNKRNNIAVAAEGAAICYNVNIASIHSKALSVINAIEELMNS